MSRRVDVCGLHYAVFPQLLKCVGVCSSPKLVGFQPYFFRCFPSPALSLSLGTPVKWMLYLLSPCHHLVGVVCLFDGVFSVCPPLFPSDAIHWPPFTICSSPVYWCTFPSEVSILVIEFPRSIICLFWISISLLEFFICLKRIRNCLLMHFYDCWFRIPVGEFCHLSHLCCSSYDSPGSGDDEVSIVPRTICASHREICVLPNLLLAGSLPG